MVSVPLAVVLDRQADIWEGEVNAGNDLAAAHDPVLGDNRNASEV